MSTFREVEPDDDQFGQNMLLYMTNPWIGDRAEE
jgi:hypothetical protein